MAEETIASTGYNSTYTYTTDSNKTWSVGQPTATGPSLTWPDTTTGMKIDYNPPTGIQFPDFEFKKMDKTFREAAEQISQSMVEELDRLFMKGTEPRKEKKKKMPKNSERTLYNIYVVDPEDGTVVAVMENVIAKDVEAAKVKALYELVASQGKLQKELDEYDLLVEDVADYGSIRPKKTD
jgi:hypothetical protein